MNKFLLFAIVSVACALGIGSQEPDLSAPVFVWGQTESTYLPALQSFGSEEFATIISPEITPETFTVVFVEKELTNEVLSRCRYDGKSCFPNIQRQQNKLYITSVDDPVSGLRQFAGQRDIRLSPDTIDTEISDIKPVAGEILFIEFDDDVEGKSAEQRYAEHDRIIGRLTDSIRANGKRNDIKTIFIWTADQSIERVNNRRVVRNAQAAINPNVSEPVVQQPGRQDPPVTDTEFVFRNPKVLIYFKSLHYQAPNQNPVLVNIDRLQISNEQEESFQADLIGDGHQFSFVVHAFENGYWHVSDYTFDSVNISSTERIQAVKGFSFHCSPAIHFHLTTLVQIASLVGLQIEPNFDTSAVDPMESFSDSWDCVGFTSPGIWGGLFVTILLLGILTIGLSWMMDIRTMDRFDDPKGKTITISAAD